MYEITYITKEQKDIKEIKTLVEKIGAKIIKEESLGRKKFAYPIKKQNAGYYTTIYFDADGKILTNLEKKLLLNQEILRFLIIKSEKEFDKFEIKKVKEESKKIAKKPIRKAAKEKIEKPAIAKVVKEPLKRKEKIETKPEKIIKKEKIEKPKLTEEEVTEEERLAKLEEKLDELLKE